MEVQWKQHIRRELRRRDKTQMGNYGSLVESYTQLQEEQEKEAWCWFKSYEKSKKMVTVENSSTYNKVCDVPDRGCCQDPQKLREEVNLLLNRLVDLEREHEHLLSRMMEDKVKEAERMNQHNMTTERYRQLKEKLQGSTRKSSYNIRHNDETCIGCTFRTHAA